MRTLITDPFRDDVAEILGWGYGEDAREMFLSMRHTGVHRLGQAFMNTLSIYDGESYNRISGSLVDPFYQDSRIPAALDKLTSK